MLTLFPRIKPNPLPSLPPDALEAKPVLLQQGADAASATLQAATDAFDSGDTGTIDMVSAEALPPPAAETATPESSVTDADLLEAFMSGMAQTGSDPFVVAITAPPLPKAESASPLLPPEPPSRPSAAVVKEASQKTPELESEGTIASPSPIAPEPNTDLAVSGLLSAGEDPADASPAPQFYVAAANIFDELDILHEAVPRPAVPAAPEPQAAAPPQPDAAQQRLVTATEIAAATSADDPSLGEQTATAIAEPDSQALPQAAPSQAQQAPLSEVDSPPAPKSGPAAPPEAVDPTAQARTEPAKRACGAPLSPPKPRRAKGTFFGLARVPEPEAMEDSGEVAAYSSAAAQSHLDAIDDTFVAHAQLLLKGRERGRALDIGTGPGQILIKLGYRLSLWKFVGIDRSAGMIEKARESLATAGELAGRVEFRIADGNALDFPERTFDLVVCNSVLHHIVQPQRLFSEIARVVKPGGAVLLRDLRRPSRWGYSYHVCKHGKYYTGEMRRLFMASVMAAYTEQELERLLASSALRDVRIFRHRKTHIGFERALAAPAERKR